MTWLLRLYPRDWQHRYGAEVREVIASQPPSLQLAVDLLGGAIDAHLKPQAFARRLEEPAPAGRRKPDMLNRLMRCDRATANMSTHDARVAGGISLGSALVIAAILMLTSNKLLQTILITMSPGIYMIGFMWIYLRGHSRVAQVLLTLGPLVILFLIGLAAGLAVSD